MAKNIDVGKVIRLYVNRGNTTIRLDIEPKEGPKDGYFRLRRDHENYNALYSLALPTWAINLLYHFQTEDGSMPYFFINPER